MREAIVPTQRSRRRYVSASRALRAGLRSRASAGPHDPVGEWRSSEKEGDKKGRSSRPCLSLGVLLRRRQGFAPFFVSFSTACCFSCFVCSSFFCSLPFFASAEPIALAFEPASAPSAFCDVVLPTAC